MRHTTIGWRGMGLSLLNVLAVCLLLFVGPLRAQDGPPTLTETQRLTFQLLSQRVENAQLRAQLAQRDFDAARAEIVTLARAVQVDGYTFDLASLTYIPVPTPQETPR